MTGSLAGAATGTVLAEENVLIPHLDELIIGTIAFGLLFALLAWKVFPMVEKLYQERRDTIEGGLKRAEEAQAEAQRTLAEYRGKLAGADAEAEGIREEARREAREIVETARRHADDEATRIVARGESQLAAERTQVVTSLRGDVGRMAVDLSERIIGSSLADEDSQRSLIDRYLAELEAEFADGDAGGAGADGPGA